MEDLSEALGIEIEADEDVDTLGGLVFSRFSAIPKDGEKPEVDIGRMHIRVEKIEDHRLESAVITVIGKDPEET